MRKIVEVQQAKELMNAAMDWSVFKWLFEKPRVRETADRANAALDKLDRSVKARWREEVKSVYKTLSAKKTSGARGKQEDQPRRGSADSPMKLLVEKVKEADEAAMGAREDAESTFDAAEKQMNIGLAREGCRKAIHSWELHEKAIRRAEALESQLDKGEAGS